MNTLDTSKAGTNLYSALLKFQGEVTNVPKDKKNSERGYMYTSLEALNYWLRPYLQKYGLLVQQFVESNDELTLTTVDLRSKGDVEKGVEKHGFAYPCSITTVIVHAASGESISSKVTFLAEPVPGNPVIRSVGAGITYFRRYALMAALNIVGDDDLDGVMPEQQQPDPEPPKPENKPAKTPKAPKPAEPARPDPPPADTEPVPPSERQTPDPEADIKAQNEAALAEKRAEAKETFKDLFKKGLTKEGLGQFAGNLYDNGAISTPNSTEFTVDDWEVLLTALREEYK